MKTITDLYSMYFIWNLIMFLHILASLTISSIAAVVRVRIFELQVPFLDKIEPNYLKLDTR